MTQGESFKVRRPPLPAPLWVRLVISSRNCLPVVVTVNVTQRESAIRGVPKNTSGLPKPLWVSAKVFPNAQVRPGWGGAGGGASIVPAERSAACEPVVTNTMSSDVSLTHVATSPRSYLSRLTVMRPDDWVNSISLTYAPFTNFTCFPSSQATSGLTKASCWLNCERKTCAMVEGSGNR